MNLLTILYIGGAGFAVISLLLGGWEVYEVFSQRYHLMSPEIQEMMLRATFTSLGKHLLAAGAGTFIFAAALAVEVFKG